MPDTHTAPQELPNRVLHAWHKNHTLPEELKECSADHIDELIEALPETEKELRRALRGNQF